MNHYQVYMKNIQDVEMSEMRGRGRITINVVNCQKNAGISLYNADVEIVQHTVWSTNVGSFATFPNHTADKKT